MHKYIHNRIRKDTHDTVFMAITGHMVTADILWLPFSTTHSLYLQQEIS